MAVSTPSPPSLVVLIPWVSTIIHISEWYLPPSTYSSPYVIATVASSVSDFPLPPAQLKRPATVAMVLRLLWRCWLCTPAARGFLLGRGASMRESLYMRDNVMVPVVQAMRDVHWCYVGSWANRGGTTPLLSSTTRGGETWCKCQRGDIGRPI